MSKSLAQMRASTRAALPERTYMLCLAQSLVAEVEALTQEKADLPVLAVADGDEGPPRRAGQGAHPRAKEIDARLEALYDEMREHTGEVRLRAIPAGEWRRFVDANPARDENKVDEDVTYSVCAAPALYDELQRYVVAWNGDPLAEGDWEFIENRAAAGDLKQLCRIVIQMHETVGAVPKSLTRSSTITPSETA